MARYGGDIDRYRMGMHDFAVRGRGYGDDFEFGGRGEYRRGAGGRGEGESAGRFGGMRSDAGPTRWDRFPSEEGWFGEGFAEYPGADVRGGARGFGGEQRGRGYGAEYRGGGFAGGGFRGGYGGYAGSTGRIAGERYGSDYRVGSPPGGGGAVRSYGGGWGTRPRQSDADRIRAREIMTEEPECVTGDTPVADVAKKMRELDVGIIPVVDDSENRRLRGVVTDRDLAIRVLAAGKDGKAKVGEYMTAQVETVNQNDTVHDVLDLMKREQVRRVPVTDRDGRLVGIIAQADLAVSYAGLDLQRETEVEEAIERISEPARPRRR